MPLKSTNQADVVHQNIDPVLLSQHRTRRTLASVDTSTGHLRLLIVAIGQHEASRPTG
jgi:hypothetical protein